LQSKNAQVGVDLDVSGMISPHNQIYNQSSGMSIIESYVAKYQHFVY